MQGLSALASAAAEVSSARRRVSPPLPARTAAASPPPTTAPSKPSMMDVREGLPTLKLGFLPRTAGASNSPNLLNSFAPALFTMAGNSPPAMPLQSNSAMYSGVGGGESIFKGFSVTLSPASDLPSMGTSSIFRTMDGTPALALGPMASKPQGNVPGQTPMGSAKRPAMRVKTPRMGLNTPANQEYGFDPSMGLPELYPTANSAGITPHLGFTPGTAGEAANMKVGSFQGENPDGSWDQMSGTKRLRISSDGHHDNIGEYKRRHKQARRSDPGAPGTDGGSGAQGSEGESLSESEAGVEANHMPGDTTNKSNTTDDKEDPSGQSRSARVAAARALLAATRFSKRSGMSSADEGVTPGGSGGATTGSDSDYKPPHHVLRGRHTRSSLGMPDSQPSQAVGMGAVLDAAGIPDPSQHSIVVTDTNAIAAYMPVGNSSAAARALPPTAIAVLKAWLLSPEHFDHPYPTDADKEALGAQCGITVRQVSVWFTNARKRIWLPLRNKQMRMKNGKGLSGAAAKKAGRSSRGGSKPGQTTGLEDLLYGDLQSRGEEQHGQSSGGASEAEGEGDDDMNMGLGFNDSEDDGAENNPPEYRNGNHNAPSFGITPGTPSGALTPEEEQPPKWSAGRQSMGSRAPRGPVPRHKMLGENSSKDSSPTPKLRKAPLDSPMVSDASPMVYSTLANVMSAPQMGSHMSMEQAMPMITLPVDSLAAHLRGPEQVPAVRFPYALSTIEPAYVLNLVADVAPEAASARLMAVADALAINRSDLMAQLAHLSALEVSVMRARDSIRGSR